MTFFWLFVMVVFGILMVGGGWAIRTAVGDMDDEVRYLSPFRHDQPDE